MGIYYLDKIWLEAIEAKEKRKKFLAIAKTLNLPLVTAQDSQSGQPVVTIEVLWEILSDDKKLQELVSRSKLKEFW